MYPEEEPARTIHVAAFSMQAHEVTNAQFDSSSPATSHATDAERLFASGDPAGGSALFVMPEADDGGASGWALKRGATWKTPGGPGTGVVVPHSDPVVHVRLAMRKPMRPGQADAFLPRRKWNTRQPAALPILPIVFQGHGR